MILHGSLGFQPGLLYTLLMSSVPWNLMKSKKISHWITTNPSIIYIYIYIYMYINFWMSWVLRTPDVYDMSCDFMIDDIYIYDIYLLVWSAKDTSCFKALLSGSLQHGDLDTAFRLLRDAFDRGQSAVPLASLELFLLQAQRRGRKMLAESILEDESERWDWDD